MRNLVIGDIHGHYERFMQLLEKLNLQPDDIVYLVGDILDRAPSPQEQKRIIDWCMENVTQTGQFRMVLGNHEYTAMSKILYAQAITFGEEESVMDALLSNDNNYFLFNFTIGMNIDWDAFAKFAKGLPLFYKVNTCGETYIITHSWVCDNEGGIVDKIARGSSYTVNTGKSVTDRKNYITQPESCIVIHGHYPTTMLEFYKLFNPGQYPVGLRVGNNICVDSCCFAGRDKGNLTAYCIEEDRFYYLWDNNTQESFKGKVRLFGGM